MVASGSASRVFDGLVDTDRFPIDRLGDDDGTALVTRCRAQLADTGVCQLHGFFLDGAVAETLELAARSADRFWASDQTHTVYFEEPSGDVPADDPRARLVRSAKRALAYDLIPATAPLRRLYEADEFTEFVAAVLDKPRLYRSADPLDALEIAEFRPGDELGWHFDRSEFSVTIMLRPATEGGDFDYVPATRSDDRPDYHRVQQALDGDPEDVLRLDTSPGTLALFHGHHALHRVTEVRGDRSRINAVLTFGERDDMRLNELTQRLFYGRVA